MGKESNNANNDNIAEGIAYCKKVLFGICEAGDCSGKRPKTHRPGHDGGLIGTTCLRVVQLLLSP